MTTFHRFPDLPPELRIQIWKHVIREDKPGVHIFNHEGPGPMMSEGWRSWTFTKPLPSHYFNSVRKDVPRKNISTYLIDGGMWTACKESRSIMEGHFRQSECVETISIPAEERNNRFHAISEVDKFNMPSTGNFVGSPMHFLTVRPNQDLFVLQVECLDNVNWDDIGYDHALGSGFLAYSGIINIGIEFNPDWWDSENKEWDDGVMSTLIDAAHNAYPVGNIWIIDHGLKRRKDAPAFEEATSNNGHSVNAFFASDRALLEVDSRHLESWTDSRTGLSPDDSWQTNNTPLSFAKNLQEDIDDERDCETDNPRRDRYPCSIGILGWDDL
ncbi:unnamed protein product [Fusarium graminearum]|nr:hypothetical protein FGRA07_08502 [Fusarium graminearum]CAG1976963.1 unnamed protein product [Fusarium graminearum]CAG2009189.1 unnamed protein product [Fusarium graminearum]CAG2017107.1 unnamed protein product [Fusarium graminearum]